MNQYKLTPKTEIDLRIQKLQQKLQQTDCTGAMIIHHTNLFYFSGTSQSGHLFIPKAGEPVLMIRKSFQRAKTESPINNIIEVKSLKQLPDTLKNAGFNNLKQIGLELDVIPYNTCQMYQKIFEDTQLTDISNIVKPIRLIKSEYEIALLKEACGAIDDVFAHTPEMIKEGMSEIELSALFEAGMRKRGYGGCCKMRAFNQDFFFGAVVSGSSGAAPTYFNGPIGGPGLTPANNPHGAGWKKIQRNEIIYIDFTCVVNGYTADQARMFAIGDLPSHLVNAHKAALAIQEEIVKLIEPSVECQTIFQKASEMAADMGLSDHFMGQGENQVRFIGHGVGLELDELPVFADGIKMILEPGMTFAIEPKFVFDDGAIGIENTYALTEGGIVCLTKSPEDIIYL